MSFTVGKQLGRAAPYASFHSFHGSANLRAGGVEQKGSDAHSFQLAFGLSALVGRGFQLFAEGAPAGARAATVGLSREL
ncbi:MAG: hypothetical protein NVS4B10_24450 [Myxococcales bacterium]